MIRLSCETARQDRTMKDTILETDRLLLRELRDSDFAALRRMLQDLL